MHPKFAPETKSKAASSPNSGPVQKTWFKNRTPKNIHTTI